MAYTKTVWEDLPSEDTPIVSTALNNMEDGIEFAVITTAPTAVTNGDYKCTTTGVTLTAGQCYKMLFPAPTDGTKNARLSIDNGSNYKDILFFNSSTNVPSALLSGLNADLCYSGTNFYLKTPVSGTWTPVLSATGSMTIESPTITEAKYRIVSGLCFFVMSCSFTTAGTQSSTVLYTLPFVFSAIDKTGNPFNVVIYAGSSQAGFGKLTALSGLKTGEARRYDGSASGWGIGANRVLYVSGFYYLA